MYLYNDDLYSIIRYINTLLYSGAISHTLMHLWAAVSAERRPSCISVESAKKRNFIYYI